MIHASADVRTALPHQLPRTLAADRYLQLPASPQDDQWRHDAVSRIGDGAIQTPAKLVSWQSLLDRLAREPLAGRRLHVVRATSTSRLLVNLGGTVMENGGICLDRVSGLPYLPGSAVKGCTRREAIAYVGTQTSDDRVAWLRCVVLLFGWGPNDWDADGDLAFACRADWPAVRERLQAELREDLDATAFPGAFRGWISFLPAFPESDPGIEADILTPHHSSYYANADPSAVATDDEAPVPLVFPAIKPGTVWRFPFLTDARCDDELATIGADFVAAALTTGFGAKASAGYGRFKPHAPHDQATPAFKAKDYHFTLTTPCMCAGADQRCAEMRAPSLRGVLRWWFRAVGGTAKQESVVFGGVAGKAQSSAFSLELIPGKPGDAKWMETGRRNKYNQPIRLLQNPNEDLSYLWHWAAVSSDERRLWSTGRKAGVPNLKGAIPPGTSFTLRFRWRRTLSPDVERVWNLAFACFIAFGAVGLRASRGMGSWHCNSAPPPDALAARLKELGFTVQISDRRFDDWKSAANYLAKWLKYDLRKTHPVGGDKAGARQPPLVKNQNPSALGSADPRQASAVHFRVLRDSSGKFVPLAFEAPHDRILGEMTKRRNPPRVLKATTLRGTPPGRE